MVNEFLYNPWERLLWFNFEDIKWGFVDEKCVDEHFLYIMQELKRWLGEADCDWPFISLHFICYHPGMFRIKINFSQGDVWNKG
jgi:hypothetical protein